jgi:predicted transcriptional regulator
MKLNYYRKLLLWRDDKLTPTDLIVYDFLLMKSISICYDVYEKDGSGVNMDALSDFLESSENKLDLYSISYRKLAKELNVSLASIYGTINKLKNLGVMGSNWIFCDINIVRGGYFQLRMDLKNEISGKLLIFYSWLCDKAKNNIVDAYRSNIAKYFNDKETNIHNMIQRLYKLGFIERAEYYKGIYGKLKLLK